MNHVLESAALDDLVRSAQRGNANDLELLLVALRPTVCRWALVWTGSPDQAEDVAQRVLLRVDRSLQSFAAEGRTMTWLYRITKNVLIDLDRARARDRSLRDRLRREQVARAAAARDDSASLEALDLMHHMMEALSPQQRAVLDLVDLQGFTAEEVSQMLDVAPATVRVHLHRARQALRARTRSRESGGHDG